MRVPGRKADHPDRPGDLRFAEVTQATRADFEALFEAKGGPRYCWCMAWRALPGRREHVPNAVKKQVMTGLIEAGTPVGILAYSQGEAVGWCSVAPRQTYRRLSPQQDDAETGIWSIVCFYVPRRLRGTGMAAALLEAAVKHAFEKGARAVEAYPVDRASPSYSFMGFRDMFSAHGFRETGTAGSRRHVMRLERP
jgi:GNAT superfamily N-acetyltransferase